MTDSVCPGCGARVRAIRNPYFGTSLSVHEFLLDCRKCGRVTFVEGETKPIEQCETTRTWSDRFRDILNRFRGSR